MKTSLDNYHDFQLESIVYDGNNLIAEVCDLVVGGGGRVLPGNYRYTVTFHRPISHAVTEEFPAVLADWVRGEDLGFVRRIENPDLVSAMGLNEEQFNTFQAFALVTAHEILVVFCETEPEVIQKHA